MNVSRRLSSLELSLILLVLMGCAVSQADSPPASGNPEVRAPVTGSPRPSVPGQAKLVRGSESVRGVAGFGRNVIPALYGEYALPSASGEDQLVSVWFTRQALVLDESWLSRTCPGLPAGFALSQSAQAGDGLLVLVASTAEYRMVIRLAQDFDNPCRFIAVLLERFIFFMRNAVREEDLSFPAFLQL